MSVLQAGFETLLDTMIAQNGEPIVYRRGDLNADIQAVRGESEFDRLESDGESRTLMKSVDWIMRLSDLDFGSGPVEPERGDTITTADGQVFDLMPGRSENSWRWLNSYRTGYRIHTMQRKVA